MVENKNSRVDFGMAEALAFGTLALHRGVRPPAASAGGHDSHDWQPSTLDSQLQQEELIGADSMAIYICLSSGQDVVSNALNVGSGGTKEVGLLQRGFPIHSDH